MTLAARSATSDRPVDRVAEQSVISNRSATGSSPVGRVGDRSFVAAVPPESRPRPRGGTARTYKERRCLSGIAQHAVLTCRSQQQIVTYRAVRQVRRSTQPESVDAFQVGRLFPARCRLSPRVMLCQHEGSLL